MACPVIGTTTDVLPPNHPSVDMSKDGQTVSPPQNPFCPSRVVTNENSAL
jgi:hypothetical protein